jgi:hypothetical protein
MLIPEAASIERKVWGRQYDLLAMARLQRRDRLSG